MAQVLFHLAHEIKEGQLPADLERIRGIDPFSEVMHIRLNR